MKEFEYKELGRSISKKIHKREHFCERFSETRCRNLLTVRSMSSNNLGEQSFSVKKKITGYF